MAIATRALAFASRWFDDATVRRTFEPLIADWQREWQDAEGGVRIRVLIGGGAALLIAMIAESPAILLAPWPAGTLRRVITRVAVWTTVISALMLIPFANGLGDRIHIEVSLYLVMLLLPSTIAVAFPFAIATVVDVIRTAPQPSREERIAAARLGIGAVALMVILAGWVFPIANQQFRVVSARAANGSKYLPSTYSPAPGLREMSLIELLRDDAFNRKLWAGRESWVAARANSVRAEIAQRTALMVFPIVLMWMRWRALRLPRGRWYSAWPLVASAPLTMVLLLNLLARSRAVADALFAPRWLGPWLAVAVVVAGSMAIDRLRQAAARRA